MVKVAESVTGACCRGPSVAAGVVFCLRLNITADTNVLVRALVAAGGDFADGVIAHQGQWLGGDTFVSFDRQAVVLLRQQGVATQLLPSRL